MRKMSNRYGITFITRKIFFMEYWLFFLHFWFIPGISILSVFSSRLFCSIYFSWVYWLPWFVCSLERSIKQLGTIRAFNYIYLNPLFTLVGSAFLLGEQLTIVALMGAVLILGEFIGQERNKYKINGVVSHDTAPLLMWFSKILFMDYIWVQQTLNKYYMVAT